jgi:tetratricopeptide (TPR) repeat protein
LAERAAVNPFDPVALNNLAISEAARGRYQQALMLLQRAVKLAPARPDIAANLHSLQRWLVLAEGQAAVGASPQPLALPYQENLLPEVPSLWQAPPVVAPGALPVSRSVPVINNNPTKNISPAAPATITKPLAQKAIPSSTAWHARKKSTSSIKPIKEKEGR